MSDRPEVETETNTSQDKQNVGRSHHHPNDEPGEVVQQQEQGKKAGYDHRPPYLGLRVKSIYKQ